MKYPISNIIGNSEQTHRPARPLFSAFHSQIISETRVVTGFQWTPIKKADSNFFVESPKSHVLTFRPVVEKNYARSREILTIRFPGAARSNEALAVRESLCVFHSCGKRVQNPKFSSAYSSTGNQIWISGSTSSRPSKSA